MSGYVAFTRNWSSPSSLAYELLWLLSLLSGFGIMGEFGSKGIVTGFVQSNPLHFKIVSMYCHWPMEMELAVQVISIPIILEGSPRSIIFHSSLMLTFILSIRASNVANNSKSSTQTVIMAKPLSSHLMYMQGSECIGLKPCLCITQLNSMFHAWPDCFRPYRDFKSSHMQSVPSLKPSGCCMYTHSSRVPLR